MARRLTNPRGFIWDSKGDLYVSLAGSGGAEVLGTQTDGYATTGLSGIVGKVGEDGNPISDSNDLPSTTVSGERTLGPAAVAFLGDDLYVLEDANAMAYRRNSGQPDGVYRVNPDGSLTLVADTAAWISANPTVYKPADYNPEGELYDMVTVGNALWVTESNNGQVLKIELDGEIDRVADFRKTIRFPPALAPSPNGGVYVGFLTPCPVLRWIGQSGGGDAGWQGHGRVDGPDLPDSRRRRARRHALCRRNGDGKCRQTAVRRA